MSNTNNTPTTLIEAVRYFADLDRCSDLLVQMKYPSGTVTCPDCGTHRVGYLQSRRAHQCKERACRRQFSARVGTIFENSPLPLDKLFVSLWVASNTKNGVSSPELARSIGVTQKTAWYLLHRIRYAMKINVSQSRHISRQVDAIERTVEENTTSATCGEANGVPANAARQQADVYDPSDHIILYSTLRATTGDMANFWTLLRRCVSGTHTWLSEAHVDAYLDEQVFRFNERKHTDHSRFEHVLVGTVGKRLKYEDLISRSSIGRS